MAAGTTSTPSQNKTVSGGAYNVFAAAKRCIGCKSECDQRHQCERRQAITFVVPFLVLMFLAFLMLDLHCSRLKPKPPHFLVDSASFSELNFTGSNLTAYGLVSLRVINPNLNYTVCYDQLHALLFYGGESKQPLDLDRAPPFYQDRLGETIIRFRFELLNEYVDEEVVRARISDAGARGYAEFGVEVRAWTHFEPEEKRMLESCFWSSAPNSNLVIHCNPVTFGLSTHNGTASLMIPLRECVQVFD